MVKKFLSALMALTFAAGLMASSVSTAEARGGRGVAVGVAAGIIGLGILGAAAEARDRDYYRDYGRCYPGPEECGWRDRHCFENSYGEWVCRGGRYTCWRPEVCD
jgi:hypothetical protein